MISILLHYTKIKEKLKIYGNSEKKTSGFIKSKFLLTLSSVTKVFKCPVCLELTSRTAMVYILLLDPLKPPMTSQQQHAHSKLKMSVNSPQH